MSYTAAVRVGCLQKGFDAAGAHRWLAAGLATLAVACGGELATGGEVPAAGGSGATGGAGGSGGSGGRAPACPPSSPGVCSLAVVAIGALPPVTDASRIEGPAIVTTEAGFVIAYYEEGSGGVMRTLRLDDCGKASPGLELDLAQSGLLCAGDTTAISGIGLAYSGSNGLLAKALDGCGSGAGVLFATLDASGHAAGASAAPTNPSFMTLALGAPSGALAASAAQDRFEFVYAADEMGEPQVERVLVQGGGGVGFASTEVVEPLPSAARRAKAATSSQVRAFIGHTPMEELLFTMGPQSGAELAVHEPSTVATLASWSDLTAWGKRAAVVFPSSNGSLGWMVAELDSASFSTVGQGSLAGPSAVSAAGVASAGDVLFFAGASSGTVEVRALRHANGSITTEGSLRQTVAVSGTYDATRIALAVGHERVALAWSRSGAVAAGTPAGGFALLQCSP